MNKKINQGFLKEFVESQRFINFITVLIIINAIVLGMETYPTLMVQYGPYLIFLDTIILWIFVAELALRLIIHKKSFFKDPWSLFDTFVVAIAFVPSSSGFSILRVARILRVLRLISISPMLRSVVEGLMRAIPGIGAIGGIMIILMYVFSVISTKLYGAQYPEWFGTLEVSAFSLFQIMTLEGWPDIVRTVMQTHPYSWIFFITYILIGTFSVLNLFIAVIVEAMQKRDVNEEKENHSQVRSIKEDIAAISKKLDILASSQNWIT